MATHLTTPQRLRALGLLTAYRGRRPSEPPPWAVCGGWAAWAHAQYMAGFADSRQPVPDPQAGSNDPVGGG